MLRVVSTGTPWSGVAAYPGVIWVCFFFFWLLNIFVIWKGINTIRLLEGVGAPLMLAVGILLFWWITNKAGGLGPVFNTPSKFRDNAEFFRFFIPSLTGMVGFWSTVALNIPTSPIRHQPACPGARSNAGFANRHDRLFVHRRGSHFRVRGPVRRADLGSRRADRPVQPARRGDGRTGRDPHRDSEHQRRRNVVSPSNDFSNLNPRLISFRTGG